jgi:predicted nucleic acid-binding protein
MKSIYLLDTNVISEFTKPKPNQALVEKVYEHNDLCAICSTVWQESVYGFEKMPEGRQKKVIGRFIDKIRENYDIIPYDSFAAQICGEIRAKCKNAGTPAPFFDNQIAATAIANNMILVTHNTEDYSALQEHSMLRIEDWWE